MIEGRRFGSDARPRGGTMSNTFELPVTTAVDSTTHRSWFAPMLGIAYALLFIGAFAGSDSGAESSTPGSELIAKHAQSDMATLLTGTLLTVSAIVLVFFGSWLRQALRSKASPSDWLPDVVLAGAILQALTLSIFVSSAHSVQDAIATNDPVIAQALNIADSNNFVTAMLGLACILIGTGLSAYRSGALPQWLAIVSIVLGVMAPLGPAGFAPFLTFPIWVVVVAFMANSARRTSPEAITVRTSVGEPSSL